MVLSEEKVGSLEEEAKKRKDRLSALKNKRICVAGDENDKTELPRPVFRSYRPTDETLKKDELADAVPVDIESMVQQTAVPSSLETEQENLDVCQLAPRKPDWDLKRDLAAKLERLERRTQRAIVELIRDRMSEQKHVADNLLAAVSTGTAKLQHSATSPSHYDP